MKLFNDKTYIERRQKLISHVKEGLILLLGNNDSPMNFKDNIYPYRQDSTFLYFIGISKPNVASVMDCDSGTTHLFGDDPTIDEIVWTGPQESLNTMGDKVGINSVNSYNELIKTIQNARAKNRSIHFLSPYRDDHKILLHRMLDISIDSIEERASLKLVQGIADQRLYKSSEELDEIEMAVNITGQMHQTAMEMARPGMKEQEIVSKLLEIAIAHGGFYSFPPIVTIDGETLHNHYYGNTLSKGDLLLVDAGAETEMGYAGDMTRTFPIGQKFTDIQKTLYQIVLDSHLKAIEALKPGVSFKEVHLIASKTLVSGLKELGLMKGDMDDAVHQGAHAMFFQCGLGHLMGLDVHDMENLGEENIGYAPDMKKSTQFGLKSLRLGRNLEEGFVLTVEPGIYIIPALIDMWKADKKFEQFINYAELEKFREFGGIRIEEDFVITRNGSRRLGKEIAKTIEDIEATISI